MRHGILPKAKSCIPETDEGAKLQAMRAASSNKAEPV